MKMHVRSLIVHLVVSAYMTQAPSTVESKISQDTSLPQNLYPLLLRAVREGGHRGVRECQEQFKNELWDCALANKQVYKKLPIFVKKTLPHATRETAFVHAISAAAITHEITHQCRMDRIPGCQCAKTKNPKSSNNVNWQWGGCSDNIKYGEKEARRFLDKLEKGKDSRAAFNLHNNKVGRKVVSGRLRRECKCHGVSGACQMKTCWKQLALFTMVGSELKKRYINAIQVSFKEGKLSGKGNMLTYLQASPDFCVRNVTAGSQGLLGRRCNSDEMADNRCPALCNKCRLRHQTVVSYRRVWCRCQFVWCCSVECDTCRKKYSVTTCIER